MKFGIDSVRHLYANRYDPEGTRAFARVYWRTLLAIAFTAMVISIAYGEWSLYGVLQDLGNVPNTTIPSSAIDRADLDAAVTGFEERQRAYEDLQKHPPSQVSDPSR